MTNPESCGSQILRAVGADRDAAVAPIGWCALEPTWHNRAVDFAGELNGIRAFLAQIGVRIAVIGGVALTAYGNPRMTLDLDIVTEASAQDALVAFMESQGP